MLLMYSMCTINDSKAINHWNYCTNSNSASSESIAALESEKNELLNRLKALEEEKAEQQVSAIVSICLHSMF